MPIQYLDSGPMKFGYGTREYRDNWERMFGKNTNEEVGRESERVEEDQNDLDSETRTS